GRAPRSRGSPTTARRAAAASARPACPTRRSGDPPRSARARTAPWTGPPRRGTRMPEAVELAIKVGGVLVAFLVLPLVVGQTEHKVMAHMQARVGPMYAGAFHGWAQLVADGVKFVQKEDITPVAADGVGVRLAPAVGLLPYLMVLVVIPLGPGTVAEQLDIGLFYALAVTGIGVVGMLMGAWASANKYSLLGGLRGAAQLLAYELPLVLAAASVTMAAGTLSLVGIVQAWQPWWLVWQLPAAVVFFIAGVAE